MQYNKNSKLYLVAFLFQKLTPAKSNYKIYNKELLAIIKYFKQWYIYINRPQEPAVLYDYKAINTTPNLLD